VTRDFVSAAAPTDRIARRRRRVCSERPVRHCVTTDVLRGAGALTSECSDGPDDVTFSFPGCDAEACDLLVTDRDGIGVGVGLDTLSTDPGKSTTFPVHEILGRADRWGLEALAGLGEVPSRGATITVGSVLCEQGSGGPCRVLATW
jgi:kynurenine formamidase